MTDLDSGDLDSLAGDQTTRYLPPGLVRVTVILSEYQAFTIRQ